MKCRIVRELLPNYNDGLCNDETVNEIKNHMEGCDECRAFYDQMLKKEDEQKNETSTEESPSTNFLEKFKLQILIKNIISIAIPILILVLITAPLEFPVSYNNAKIRIHPSLFTTGNGAEKISNPVMLNTLPYDRTKEVIKHDTEILKIPEIICTEIGNSSCYINYRTITNKGKKTCTIFVTAKDTLLNRMMSSYYSKKEAVYTLPLIESDQSILKDIDGTTDVEIYYLPLWTTNDLDKLSDAEFCQKKKEAKKILRVNIGEYSRRK